MDAAPETVGEVSSTTNTLDEEHVQPQTDNGKNEVQNWRTAAFNLDKALKLSNCQNAEDISSLSIKYMSISTLSEDIFTGLKNLTNLDVEGNLLDTFPENCTCLSLKSLNCSHNKLKSLKGLTMFPNLEVLDMSGNEAIQVSDRYTLVSALSKLKKLDGKDVETMREAVQRLDAMLAQKVQDLMCSKEALKQFPGSCPDKQEEKMQLLNRMVEFAKGKITCGPEVLKDYREHKIQQLMAEKVENLHWKGRKRGKNDQNENHFNESNQNGATPTKKGKQDQDTNSVHCQTEEVVRSSRLQYSLAHLLQTHSQNNDPKDWETKVWMCEFEPDVNRPGHTTNLCATCGGDSVCFIDCSTGTVIKKYKQPRENFYCLAWTVVHVIHDINHTARKASLLAVAGWHGDIKLINPERLVCYLEVSHHKRPVDALLFHPKKPHWLFSGSEDKSIVLWNIGDPFRPWIDVKASKLFTLKAGSIIRQITITPSGQCLIGGGDDGCYIWKIDNLHEGEIRHAKYKLSFIGEKRTPVDSVICVTEKIIATKRLEEGHIQLWYSESDFSESDAVLSHKLPWRQTETPFLKFNYTPVSRLLLAGDDCGFIWLFDLKKVDKQIPDNISEKKEPLLLPRINCLHCDNKYAKMLNHVAANSDGSYIVGVSDTNVVAVWRKL